MAVIEAKYNGSKYVWNPLDPDNWQGGVVPGKNDVARFKRINTVYGSYENQNYGSYTYDYGPNLNDRQILSPEHFGPDGTYSASLWTRIQREWGGRVNHRSGSQLGSSYYWGQHADDANSKYYNGYYQYIGGYNIFASSGSYNSQTDLNWSNLYKNNINVLTNHDRMPNRYFMFAYMYYVYYNNRSNTSFTVDGVTISEPNGVTGDPYYSASRPYGMSKADYLAAHPGEYTMVDRLVDLFTGSALHVSQGGRWEIRGPHNARGYGSGPTDNYLNQIRCFTIFTVTGSEYRNSSYNSGPSVSSVHQNNNNLAMSQYSSTLRAQHFYGFVEDGISGSGDTLNNMDYPIWYWDEGTGSLKYGDASLGSANQNYGRSVYATGSGHCYIKSDNFYYTGVGPGNPDWIRMKMSDIYYQYPRNFRVDPDWGTWVASSSLDYPLYQPIGGSHGHGTNNVCNGISAAGSTIYSDNIIQRWELTGSQTWEVGRIEMGGYTHLHVKDSASIKLYDLEDGTYYPSIDFYDYGTRATLLLTDSAEIATTSSRTSLVPNYESGIYTRRTHTSVIMSGSANYSSSVVASSSVAGDSSIQISNLQNTFGIGDYISIQSTGSIRIQHPGSKDYGLDYIDENNPDTWFSSSFDTGSYAYAQRSYNVRTNSLQNYAPNTYNKSQNSRFALKTFTHTIETDEITQIVSMSGDTAIVAKMYSKEGEIQSDMGLYSKSDFTTSFPSGGIPSDYAGTKRVVLTDSAHRDYQVNDLLVISGSVYKVLHATTYLSQSLFREFMSSNQPPLEEVFDLETNFSASSIWPTTQGTYGISTPSTYFTEVNMKERLLITGSYRGTTGSLAFPDSFIFNSNAVNSINYNGKTGSNEGYRALQIDATQAYYWYNAHPSYRMDLTNGSTNNTYRYHNFYSTHYMDGEYQLKGTDDWMEGEIIVSGRILRNGLFDHTSSIGLYTGNYFGFTWGCTSYTGVCRKDEYQSAYGTNATSYQNPYPYNHRIVFDGNLGGQVVKSGHVYSNAVSINRQISGSLIYPSYNNPANPYRYSLRRYGPGLQDDPAVIDSGINLNPIQNDMTASWHPMTSSMEAARGVSTGGTGHVKIKIQDGVGEYFVGTGNNEVAIDRIHVDKFRGRIALLLKDYGSIYSVNVKTRWQQLILDTQDSFNYRDRIKEGGLLYDHYAGKETKFIATEVVDAKGFKNLLWDAEYNKGASGSIRPYMYACCYTGTTAGTSNMSTTNGYRYMKDRYSSLQTLTPRIAGARSYWSYGQNNANYYIIYDFRQPVTFDTIGVVHCKDSYGYESNANNTMNDVQFEVCNDVGVAAPAWQTVRAQYDDPRQSGGRGDIRFYTFPSGSVSARYVKWKNRGGSSTANYRYFQFFGAYNFSGSCASSGTLDASSIAGGFADTNGGPTASMCQVELANVKNFSVNDYIFFWSKQFLSSGFHFSPTYAVTQQGYKNVASVTGYYNKTTDEKDVLGGFAPIYKITAISGNVVTLDKPITHEHIGAGTMAYKYNRGKVKLTGDRAAPFYIYQYSSDSQFQQLSNVTFLNGSVNNYNATEYNGLRTYEDIGAIINQENNLWQSKPGFYRNIVSNGCTGTGVPSNSYERASSNLHFNVVKTTSGRSNYASYSYPRNGKAVQNFVVSLGRSGYGHRVLFSEYYGAGGHNGKVFIQNNFLIGDYRFNHANTGGVMLSRGRGQTGDISKQLIIENNVIPDGFADNFTNQQVSNYSGGGYGVDRELLARQNMKTKSSDISWFWPNYINPRIRGEAFGYIQTYQLAGTNDNSANNNFGDKPILVTPEKGMVKRYGTRSYIMTNDYYQTHTIVKSKTFSEDQLFEMYNISDSTQWITSNGGFRPLYCDFFVNNDNTQIRIDFDLIYKTLLMRVYGYNPYSNYYGRDYNFPGNTVYNLILENCDTRDILDLTPLDKTKFATINKRDVFTLNKGKYMFYLHMREGYYLSIHHVMDFKNLDFRIVTPNLSDVTVQFSNWDLLKLFDSVDHYTDTKTRPNTQASGQNRVLKQSSDLGGTRNYKFNKIKL